MFSDYILFITLFAYILIFSVKKNIKINLPSGYENNLLKDLQLKCCL